MHKKSRFKEFRSSKEKIATNILTNRLSFLLKEGFIDKITPLGTKKSTRYIALDIGILALPIIIEMYLFSITERKLNNYNTFLNLTQQDRIDLTDERLKQFLSNFVINKDKIL